MTRHERARLRLGTREYARHYLGVTRLPAGVPAICRAYADAFAEYPYPDSSFVTIGHPFSGLAWQLRPFRKRPVLA